jgi:hypothetical protein
MKKISGEVVETYCIYLVKRHAAKKAAAHSISSPVKYGGTARSRAVEHHSIIEEVADHLLWRRLHH